MELTCLVAEEGYTSGALFRFFARDVRGGMIRGASADQSVSTYFGLHWGLAPPGAGVEDSSTIHVVTNTPVVPAEKCTYFLIMDLRN